MIFRARKTQSGGVCLLRAYIIHVFKTRNVFEKMVITYSKKNK